MKTVEGARGKRDSKLGNEGSARNIVTAARQTGQARGWPGARPYWGEQVSISHERSDPDGVASLNIWSLNAAMYEMLYGRDVIE